jgi:threonine/homoserine/homoserine lactone efflux protein
MITPLSLLLRGSALGIGAGAAPGPMQAFLISETLSGGWQRSISLIFVPFLSDIPGIVLTTFILKQFPDVLLQAISVIGGLFVLYLAWGFWKQWKEYPSKQISSINLQHRSFGKAVAMNILNPNPYIFWTFVSGPILISSLEQSWLHALAFMVGFYGIFMLTMIAFIALFHQARRLGPKVVHGIQLISIMVLVIFGAILIKEGLAG